MKHEYNTWIELNEIVMKADERECQRLLAVEKAKDRRRKMFLLRIHARLNKVRAERERAELVKIAK